MYRFVLICISNIIYFLGYYAHADQPVMKVTSIRPSQSSKHHFKELLLILFLAFDHFNSNVFIGFLDN